MAMSPAERQRRHRQRKRVARGTAGLSLAEVNGTNSREHGAHSADIGVAAAERLPDLPAYLDAAMFREAVAIVRRRVIMAERVGVWVGGLTEAEATTPSKAGSSSPAEISRQQDLAALNGLAALGLTPGAMARFGRLLEERQKPDLALLHAAVLEEESGA